MKKDVKIIMVHSERESAEAFANEVKDSIGVEIMIPENEE
ncbi:MAG: hypothetical protein DRJ20_01990, partial [Candidatus Methanomethylicota archaeon]